MKSYDEYGRTAKPGRPFSNSTDWEIWQSNVCMAGGIESRRCVNDDSSNEDGGCPLILLMLNEMRPAEWSGPHARYRCSEKTTPAEARATAKVELRRQVDDSHCGPLFDIPGGAV